MVSELRYISKALALSLNLIYLIFIVDISGDWPRVVWGRPIKGLVIRTKGSSFIFRIRLGLTRNFRLHCAPFHNIKHSMAIAYLLLVEDDPNDVELLREALSQKKPEIEIQCVENGEKLIDYLDKCRPNAFPSLILLDYNLPLMTADQILIELSRKARYNNIPKLVWSTADKAIFASRCIDRGALKYLYKPAAVSELDSLMEHIFEVLERFAGSPL
jgi:CheY-like chemotaxis protein